jgi:hypothetical protein
MSVCARFTSPPDGLYGAYCERCGYSRDVHLAGATVIDTALDRRGTIVSVDLDSLAVLVSWRPGQVTTLRPADVAAGRYQVVT